MVRQFFSSILPSLPEGGCYYITGLSQEKKPQIVPCPTIDQLLYQTDKLEGEGYNVFVGLGAYASAEDGKKKANVARLRALWCDIDVGKDDSKYASQRDAVAAVVAFSKETGLIPTYINSSGKGLHVLWSFTEGVAAPRWRQIAGAFKRYYESFGLDADPARATDVTNSPRVPGTTNHKHNLPVAVLLDKHDTLYDPDELYQKLVSKVGEEPEQQDNKSSGGPTIVSAKPIVQHCKQIAGMGNSDRKGWILAMSVLKRCKDGLDYAHQLSKENPAQYSEAEVTREFTSLEENAPARCATFLENNAELCEDCPHKGKIVTPVQLIHHGSYGSEEVPEPVQTEHLEYPPKWDAHYIRMNHPDFDVTDSGVYYNEVRKNKKTGEIERVSTLVCTTRLYLRKVEVFIKQFRPQRSYLFDAIHPDGERETLRYIIDEDGGAQNTNRWFNNAKIFCAMTGPKAGSIFMEFINAYLQSVAHEAKEVRVMNKLGWVDDFIDPVTKKPTHGFLIGSGLVTKDGMKEIGFQGDVANKTASTIFCHKGSLEAWKEVPRMYRRLRQPLGQLAMCFGFAAPLMRYSIAEARNCIFNIWSSKGGVGKSCLLRMVASIWGNPMESFFAKDTTFAAMEHKLMMWNNLPAMMDELTEMSDEEMANLAFAICSGKQREKMQRNGAVLVDTGYWETCVFTTANKSFKECIARRHANTDAATKRVMDYEWDGKNYSSHSKEMTYITRCLERAENNYGLAGPEFIYQFLQHPEKVATLRRYVAGWAKNYNFQGDERYMAYPLAIAMLAGEWAVEFGLLDYDMSELQRWVLEVFVKYNRQQTYILTPNYKDAVIEYISAQASRNMLRVKSAKRAREEPDPGTVGILDPYVLRMPQDQVNVRYEREENTMFIRKSDFRNWCKKNGYSTQSILKGLEKEGIHMDDGTENDKVILAKGVSVLTPVQARCFILRSDDLKALGYIDDEDEF